ARRPCAHPTPGPTGEGVAAWVGLPAPGVAGSARPGGGGDRRAPPRRRGWGAARRPAPRRRERAKETMRMGRKVYVIGVGMTKFEKPNSKAWDYPDMAKEAGEKALADAGVPYTAV